MDYRQLTQRVVALEKNVLDPVIELGFVKDHPWLTAGLVGAAGIGLHSSGLLKRATAGAERAGVEAAAVQPAVAKAASGAGRFKTYNEAVKVPVDREKWDALDPGIRRRARSVASLANDPGTNGEGVAAQTAWLRLRETHGFSRLTPGMISLSSRPFDLEDVIPSGVPAVAAEVGAGALAHKAIMSAYYGKQVPYLSGLKPGALNAYRRFGRDAVRRARIGVNALRFAR